jgi:hypothetical protein
MVVLPGDTAVLLHLSVTIYAIGYITIRTQRQAACSIQIVSTFLIERSPN